jgi:hypothetical protein
MNGDPDPVSHGGAASTSEPASVTVRLALAAAASGTALVRRPTYDGGERSEK